jgi:tRNA(Arg) A34 adenosine deaminase TadA
MDTKDTLLEKEKEKECMLEANLLALQSVEQGGGPFGCIITDLEYKVIAKGNNQVTQLKDPTAHAEIVAIRRACQELDTFDLSGCRLFSSCEPCPMCLSAIYWSRIQHVYYGNTRVDADFDDAFIYEEIKKDVDKRSEMFWTETKDKIFY